MRFKIDENLPIQVVGLLEEAGHDAATVVVQDLQGCADRSLAEVCRDEGRVLISLDLDFADIRGFPPAEYPGLVVLRLVRQDLDHVLQTIERLVQVLVEESPERMLWIVEENRIRIRG